MRARVSTTRHPAVTLLHMFYISNSEEFIWKTNNIDYGKIL